MSKSLGAFGAAVAEVTEPKEVMTFTLGPDKDEFHVDPSIGFVPFGEFAAAASSGLDTADMQGAAAIMDILRDLVGPMPGHGKTARERKDTARTAEQEWARFRQVCKVHKIDLDVLLELVGAIFEAGSGLPTEQPSGSPGGSPTTRTGRSSSTKQRSGRRPGMEPVTAGTIAELGG